MPSYNSSLFTVTYDPISCRYFPMGRAVESHIEYHPIESSLDRVIKMFNNGGNCIGTCTECPIAKKCRAIIEDTRKELITEYLVQDWEQKHD